MLEPTNEVYSPPLDKYGLLACWKKQRVPTLLEQVERILKMYKAQTILDCNSQTDLYISGLGADGWQVSSMREVQSSSKYDAVFCMENEFDYYKDQRNVVHALENLLGFTKEYGIVVFCVPDYDVLYGDEERQILPLLLGREIGGKWGSVIQYVHMNSEGSLVVSDYIYHVEDLASHTISVDWETIECVLINFEAVYNYIADVGGKFHNDYLLGQHHIYVFGRHDLTDYSEIEE